MSLFLDRLAFSIYRSTLRNWYSEFILFTITLLRDYPQQENRKPKTKFTTFEIKNYQTP